MYNASAAKSKKVIHNTEPVPPALSTSAGNDIATPVGTDGENSQSVSGSASGASDTRMLVNDPHKIPQVESRARPAQKMPTKQILYSSDEEDFLGFTPEKKKCAQTIDKKVLTSKSTDTQDCVALRLQKRKRVNYKY